jgi:hypothetical protein
LSTCLWVNATCVDDLDREPGELSIEEFVQEKAGMCPDEQDLCEGTASPDGKINHYGWSTDTEEIPGGYFCSFDLNVTETPY